MDTKKKKKVLGKLIFGMSVGFILTLVWIFLMMKLVDADIINSTVAAISIIGIFVAMLVSIFFTIRFFLGKIMTIFGGLKSGTDEAMDAGMQKIAARNDEIGEMARSMQENLSSIGQVVSGIRKASTELGELSTDFRNIFDTMAESVDRAETEVGVIATNTITQAEQVADMKMKVDAIGDAIEKITENIGNLANSAELMKDYDKSVEGILSELMVISQKNSDAIENVRQQTEVTNQSAQKIRSATEIIAGISSQTNLLALNASIEAARAGEHGKGFAVVAEEIRALADQSKESTEQIENVVAALLDNSSVSVAITKEVSEAFLKQNEKIKDTEAIFGSLNHEVAKVSDAIDEIAGEMEGLNSHKNVIEKEVDSLAETAKQNADSAGTTMENVEELNQIVDECNKSTEVVINVSKELIGYIGEFGEDAVRDKISHRVLE